MCLEDDNTAAFMETPLTETEYKSQHPKHCPGESELLCSHTDHHVSIMSLPWLCMAPTRNTLDSSLQHGPSKMLK